MRRHGIGESRVYPRAGRGTVIVPPPDCEREGLSPRRRGNHHGEIVPCPRWGSIPAQAGEPPGRLMRLLSLRVYPRAGGGTHKHRFSRQWQAGLSPRRRGNLDGRKVSEPDLGSIPAQAGEPSWPRPTEDKDVVYPRAGGGTGMKH